MENLDQVGLGVMRKGKYSEWSAGGPDKWHSDWQELMAKTKKPMREINDPAFAQRHRRGQSREPYEEQH